MTNLDYLFRVDMAFRDVVVELAAHAIGTTNPEFAEEWLECDEHLKFDGREIGTQHYESARIKQHVPANPGDGGI